MLESVILVFVNLQVDFLLCLKKSHEVGTSKQTNNWCANSKDLCMSHACADLYKSKLS